MADELITSPCPACGRAMASPDELGRNLCELCSRATGVWVHVPDLRPPVPCLRCNHTRFVRAQLRERSSVAGNNGGEYLAPLAVSFATSDAGVFRIRREAEPAKPIGLIVAYVCEACGFTELYTMGARDIPIGREYGTDIVDINPTAEGPYR